MTAGDAAVASTSQVATEYPPASIPLPASPTIPNDERASSNAAQEPSNEETMLTPAMLVRRNVALRVLAAVNELGLHRKALFIIRCFTTFSQIIAFIVILALTSGAACDKPLRTFLALHTVRIAISLPVNLYQTLSPGRPPRNQIEDAESQARREARRVLGSPQADAKVKTFGDLFSAFALVLFVLGNYFLWQTGSCSRPLYWASFTALLFGYIYLAEVVLIVLAVVFFLPLVIVLLRAFGVNVRKHEIGPLDQAEIDKLPLVLFIPGPEQPDPQDVEPTEEAKEETTQIETAAETDITQNETPAAPVQASLPLHEPETVKEEVVQQQPAANKRKTRRIMSLFRSKQPQASSSNTATSNAGSTEGYVAGPHPFHALPPNRSTCPICLTDFEPPPKVEENVDVSKVEWEPLRLLACGHCLHKECLDPWLLTSGRCPVCQAPVIKSSGKGKKRARSATVTSTSSRTGAARS